jgi:hypothetical protein
MRLLFDIETNGLYREVDRIHCIVVRDLDTKDTSVFNDQGSTHPVSAGLTLLEDAEILIGHNIVGYDLPVIQKIYPWFDPPIERMRDTLLFSHLRYPHIMKVDAIQKRRDMPKRLWGRHSLEAWGYRLGELKGEFGKTTDWQEWSQEMEDYCIQDTLTTLSLWHHFQKVWPGLA